MTHEMRITIFIVIAIAVMVIAISTVTYVVYLRFFKNRHKRIDSNIGDIPTLHTVVSMKDSGSLKDYDKVINAIIGYDGTITIEYGGNIESDVVKPKHNISSNFFVKNVSSAEVLAIASIANIVVEQYQAISELRKEVDSLKKGSSDV